MDEPILTNGRATTYPIEYPELWSLYKQAQASAWTAEEIDLGSDLKDWAKLNHSEKYFIKMVLAFFAGSDGIVSENIDVNFGAEVKIPEARAFYAYQSYNEHVHAETYSLMIDKLVEHDAEKILLLNAIESVSTIKDKAEWAKGWMNRGQNTFGERLVAFACLEGLFFSGSFCSIYWLKHRGLMPGLCFSNELISRDEGLHQTFACALVRRLVQKPSVSTIQTIVKSAVEIEKRFVSEALPVKLIGMSADEMCQYIEFVADRLLVQLGSPVVYGSSCPFAWMQTISLEGKTNFFEKRVGEYSKSMSQAPLKFDVEEF